MDPEATKSELMEVLATLEGHFEVLNQEIAEINRDIEWSERCVMKYGEYFSTPLRYLRELKLDKKQKMEEILTAMETFNSNLQNSKRLCKLLERNATVRQVPPTQSPYR
ncbi:hypothetical protein RCL1_006451 [Eukaryota sp. TZLM3-RCL]